MFVIPSFKHIDIITSDNVVWQTVPGAHYSGSEKIVPFVGSVSWLGEFHAVSSCPMQMRFKFQEYTIGIDSINVS